MGLVTDRNEDESERPNIEEQGQNTRKGPNEVYTK